MFVRSSFNALAIVSLALGMTACGTADEKSASTQVAGSGAGGSVPATAPVARPSQSGDATAKKKQPQDNVKEDLSGHALYPEFIRLSAQFDKDCTEEYTITLPAGVDSEGNAKPEREVTGHRVKVSKNCDALGLQVRNLKMEITGVRAQDFGKEHSKSEQ